MCAAHRIAVLLLVLLAGCAGAPPAPPAPSVPAVDDGSAAPAEADVVMESARSSVRSMAVWLARNVDSWFGDRPFEDGGKVTDGRLSVGLLTRQREHPDLNVRFDARFRLPNIEKLTYLFVGRDDEREVVTDKPGALSRQDQLTTAAPRERSFFAGLGRSLNDAVDFRLGVRGGLKPYAQARYRNRWLVGTDSQLEFRQTVFWTVADRIGSTTSFSYEHAFSPTLAARWINSATVTQELPKFVWSSLLGAYQAFGDQRLLSVEGVVNGQQDSGVGASDYGVQSRWEQPVHKDWLIGGIVVGHFWPRPDPASERRGAWALGVSLKMKF